MNTPSNAKSVFVKLSKCHVCGATKSRPPKTAFVYCDHCAALIDWDFEIALATPGSAMPGPRYEQLRSALQSELDAAYAAGDRARYAAAQAQLYDAYIDACPAALPPRIVDPAYRARYLAYTVASMVEQDFDEDCRFLTHEMDKAVKGLIWNTKGGERPRVASAPFWIMVRALKARTERGLLLNVKSGLVKTHPDAAPPDLLARMALSMFVQGWLPYLAAEDAERLLDESRLRGEYRAIPEIGEERPCPACDQPLHVVDGAVRVLCEACGQRIDVGALQVACAQCGGPMSIPGGADRAPCPFCGTEARAVRVPGVRTL